MEGVIYKFFNNINSKVYIGQTLKESRRFWEHKNCKGESYFHNAIKKYGFENFSYEVLERVDESLLDERETYWISYYDSTNKSKGYNLESGGNFGKHHSEETKQKLSKFHKGMKLSEETKIKMSETHKGLFHSEDTRRKISESLTGRIVSDETKQKLSEVRKGMKHTEDTLQKLREMESGENNPFYGKHHSDETRKRISESKKGKHWKIENGVRIYY